MRPANRLRELRKAAKLTQEELGDLAGFAQETISHFENDRRPLQIDHMRALAQALKCSVADILDQSDNPDRLSEEERRFIEMFRHADSTQRATAQHMAEAALSFKAEPARDAA